MKTQWTVKIRIKDRNSGAARQAIERLKASVHETVSALVSYYKHARPPGETARIGTNVESMFDDKGRRPALKRKRPKL